MAFQNAVMPSRAETGNKTWDYLDILLTVIEFLTRQVVLNTSPVPGENRRGETFLSYQEGKDSLTKSQFPDLKFDNLWLVSSHSPCDITPVTDHRALPVTDLVISLLRSMWLYEKKNLPQIVWCFLHVVDQRSLVLENSVVFVTVAQTDIVFSLRFSTWPSPFTAMSVTFACTVYFLCV